MDCFVAQTHVVLPLFSLMTMQTCLSLTSTGPPACIFLCVIIMCVGGQGRAFHLERAEVRGQLWGGGVHLPSWES